MESNYKLIGVFITIAVLLSCCSTTITKGATEKEIVSFMLDFIVQKKIGGTVNYIQTSGQTWVDAPPSANIVIWRPPAENVSEYSIAYLKNDEPIKVWLYADNNLVEVADKKGTIEEYVNNHISNPQSDIWAWGYYEFGILSISDDNKLARVYVGISRGRLCGQGIIYTLRKTDQEKWLIVGEKIIWIS